MILNFFRAFLSLLVLTTLISACGDSRARNKKLTGVSPKGGTDGSNQKASAGLDKWIDLEKKKPDSIFQKSSLEQSTFDMSKKVMAAYQSSVKGKAGDKTEEKNKVLQAMMGHVLIKSEKKDDKLAITINVYDSKSETTKKHLVDFTGEISPATGSGPLKAEIIDPDLKQMVDKQGAPTTKPANGNAKTPNKPGDKPAAKGERFTADAKCFDKDCYNMLIRIFDNKAGGFLVYFYHLVDVVNQSAEGKAKINSPALVDLKKKLEEKKRPDVFSEGKFETDGYHVKLNLDGGAYDFKSIYTLALVKGAFNFKMLIKEKSGSTIPGESAGLVTDEGLEEFTVLLKKK